MLRTEVERTIVVNGHSRLCTYAEVPYVYIIAMADGRETDTVTYRGQRGTGFLSPGETVEVEENMTFNVYPTG